MKTRVFNVLRTLFRLRMFENVLVPYTIDKEFGTLMTKLPPNHYQYPKNTIRKVSRRGINYHLDISDMVDWYIYFGFKENSRVTLNENIKTGDVVLDVGGNVGDVALTAAKIVGPSGKVMTFEPDRVNISRMMRNFDLNHFENIEIVDKGVGDQKGTLFLGVVNERNRGMNKAIQEPHQHNDVEEVQVIKIDDLMKERGMTYVNLIKIDVEGYEMKVLNGAMETIKACRPILFVEVDSQNLNQQGHSVRDIVDFLKRHNYEIKNAENKEVISSGVEFDNCHFDIICHPQ